MPTALIDIHIQFNFIDILLVKTKSRNKAYLPNFKVIPARIIDPIVGASTCALGNHKCNKNIGIFIRKATISPKYKTKSKGKITSVQLLEWSLFKVIITTSKGRDPNRV